MVNRVNRPATIWMVILTGAALVQGCGGGNSGNDAPVIVPGPTPTPSSTPTPTPTPTATPTPVVSYDQVFDFTRDRSFRAIGARLQTTTPSGSSTLQIQNSLQPNDSTILISYAAATQMIAFRYEGEQSTVPRTPAIRNDGEIAWLQGRTATTRAETVVLSRVDLQNKYVIFGGFNSTDDGSSTSSAPSAVLDVRRIALVGSPTFATDIPTTGAVTFSPVMRSFLQTPTRLRLLAQGSVATMRVDYVARTVSATLPFQETGNDASVPPERGTLTFTGTLNSITNEISGTITSVDGSQTGTFSGKLFGPQGLEIGFVFTLSRSSDGARGIGQVIGRR